MRKPGGTIYAALTAILRERMARSGGKVTLLNCDNLRHNGERFRSGLLQFISLLNDAALHEWVDANTSSPNAMVDRITPRPTPDVARAREERDRLGRRRAGDERELHSMGDRGRFLQRPAGVGGGRRGDGRIRQALRRSEDPHPEREPQRDRLGRHAGRLRVHPRRHARSGDPADRARLRHRRRDPVPVHAGSIPARSTCRPIAMSCSIASAIPPFATPTSAWRWMATPRFRASSRRRCASAWPSGASIASVGDAARAVPRVPAALASRRDSVRVSGPGHGRCGCTCRSASPAIRWTPSAAILCCGARSPASLG